MGFPDGSVVKNLPAMQRRRKCLGQEDPPGERNGNPLQYSCPEKSHGQRSLADYSTKCHKESDMTERLSTQALKIILFNPYRTLSVVFYYPCFI